MSMTRAYRALAQAFSYPWDKNVLQSSVEEVAACLRRHGDDRLLDGLLAFISGADLTAVQEDYIAAFDLSPACAPYVGYHLHGDTHKKGEFMIRAKAFYRDHGYETPDNELPDHLSVMFAFLASLSSDGESGARRDFVSGFMLPGLKKMQGAAADKPQMRWKDLITAACLVCAADCEEVLSC